ncbi:MAG: metallophosphoesterase [Ruminococcus sp.]|nr:metallophosphoesterase [Ruminococcus sp.]
MRLIVFSDTHGSFSAAREIVERNQDVYTFIFLGDGEREIDKLRIVYPEKLILNVAGNCDYNSFTPNSDLYNAGKVKVFFTHGHRFGVKYDKTKLYEKAREVGASVALFGHTHERYYEYRDGIHLLNPGSAACPRDGRSPSYAFVDITPSGIMCSHVEL